MKEIILSQGQVALVDDSDFEWLNQWKWYAKKYKRGGKIVYYAVRDIHVPKGPKDRVLMHRAILQTPEGFETDHKDGNGTNNQRQNLRKATGSQNQANRKIQLSNTSGFRGVSFHKHRQKWRAFIVVNLRQLSLGYFFDKEEAARAYDVAARKHFGDFATLNFPAIQPA